jgi:circadian clock protein KaiC
LIERVPTGIDNLDVLLKGGFPRGGLIVLAGNCGSGKTTLAAQFLHAGATKHNEPGVFVTFAEGHSVLIDFLKTFGLDFEQLEKQRKISILDFVSMKEAGISIAIDQILTEISSIKAKRLVIDSFSAVASSLEDKSEVRIMLHAILSKMVRQLGCTTLIVVEIPWGAASIGMGAEEFVSDGVIMINSFVEDFEMKRRMLIVKMRGTEHSTKYHDIAITANGISIVPVPTMK